MGFVHVAFIMAFIVVLSPVPVGSSKYLHGSDYNTNANTTEEPSHTQGGSSCTSRDLSISQGQTGTGILPVYRVQIINTCESHSRCAPSNIHLHCGWFASAKLVNPNLFKRLSYDDCLVNNGQRMRTGQVISFSYSNTVMYPISFKYATFC